MKTRAREMERPKALTFQDTIGAHHRFAGHNTAANTDIIHSAPLCTMLMRVAGRQGARFLDIDDDFCRQSRREYETACTSMAQRNRAHTGFMPGGAMMTLRPGLGRDAPAIPPRQRTTNFSTKCRASYDDTALAIGRRPGSIRYFGDEWRAPSAKRPLIHFTRHADNYAENY